MFIHLPKCDAILFISFSHTRSERIHSYDRHVDITGTYNSLQSCDLQFQSVGQPALVGQATNRRHKRRLLSIFSRATRIIGCDSGRTPNQPIVSLRCLFGETGNGAYKGSTIYMTKNGELK